MINFTKKYTLILAFFLQLMLCFINVFNLRAQTIINGYANVSSIATRTVLSITAGAANQSEIVGIGGSGTFTVGNQIIVMQMQADVIGSNRANNASFGNLDSIKAVGLYERATISAITRTAGVITSVTVSAPLNRTYQTNANSSVQIITYPQLGAPNFSTTADLTALTWNGNIGGVLALNVPGTLTLQHNLNVNGRGFRGGIVNPIEEGGSCNPDTFRSGVNNSAHKGEGIYKSVNTIFQRAIGKILTGGGGGNTHNGGGGGGSNFTTGGRGGAGWNCLSTPAGGLGGIALPIVAGLSRVFMGGGGGGGQQNNNLATNGGNGGGIILVRANQIISGSCTNIIIAANGSSVPLGGGNDAGGGAGGGGSIVLEVNSWSIANTCPLSVQGSGGAGGSVNDATLHGGGGGGGQGRIFFAMPTPTTNVTVNTLLGIGGCNENTCATSAQNGGGPNNAGIFSNVLTPLPIELLYFRGRQQDKTAVLDWAIVSSGGSGAAFFEIEKSINQMRDFEKIEIVISTNQVGTALYNFIDKNFGNKPSYYRLRMVETDGKSSYSPIILVKAVGLKELSELQISPVPATNYIDLHNLVDAALEIEVVDIQGRVLIITHLQQGQKDNTQISIGQLKSGLYMLKVRSNDGKSVVKKFVKI